MSLALRTLLSLGWIIFKVLENTALAEGAQTLVDSVSISVDSLTQPADEVLQHVSLGGFWLTSRLVYYFF